MDRKCTRMSKTRCLAVMIQLKTKQFSEENRTRELLFYRRKSNPFGGGGNPRGGATYPHPFEPPHRWRGKSKKGKGWVDQGGADVVEAPPWLTHPLPFFDFPLLLYYAFGALSRGRPFFLTEEKKRRPPAVQRCPSVCLENRWDQHSEKRQNQKF